MKEKDVIIVAFSCGGKMNCRKEANKFDDPPIILSAPNEQVAKEYRAHNSVLDNFFAARRELIGIKPRRICLVSFAEGWGWSNAVLKAKNDRTRIDTVLSLDGGRQISLQAWVDYGSLAAKNKGTAPRLWLAYTQNTRKANEKIYNQVNKRVGALAANNFPEYIEKATLDKTPIRIYSKEERPTTKLYHQDPLLSIQNVGNLICAEYQGNSSQDSSYICQYVQPRFWTWLRNLWADPTIGVFFNKDNKK